MNFFILLFGVLLHLHLVTSMELAESEPKQTVPPKEPHYDIHLSMDMKNRTYKGKVDVTITPLRDINKITFSTVFDFDEVRVIELKYKETNWTDADKMDTLENKRLKLGEDVTSFVDEIRYIPGLAVIELNKPLLVGEEYVVTIFYSEVDSEAFVWLNEMSPKNGSETTQDAQIFRTAILQAFNNSIIRITPVFYGDVVSQQSTFQILLETDEQYSGASNTKVQLTQTVNGKSLILFEKTEKINSSLLTLMVTDLRASEYGVDASSMKHLRIYSLDTVHQSEDNLYVKCAKNAFSSLATHFLVDLNTLNLDVLITTSDFVKENPSFRTIPGLLIVRRDSDEDTIFKRMCETLTSTVLLMKMQIMDEYWFLQSVSRYIVQEILKRSGKYLETTEDNFETITSVIEETTKIDRILQEPDQRIITVSEIIKRKGLALINVLADGYSSFNDCVAKFLNRDDPTIKNFALILYNDPNSTKIGWDSKFKYPVHAFKSIMRNLKYFRAPKINLQLNGKQVTGNRGDLQTGFTVRTNNGTKELMPVLAILRFVNYTPGSKKGSMTNTVSEFIQTDPQTFKPVEDFNFYELDRKMPLKPTYDKESWAQFNEIAKAIGYNSEGKAFLISDITDIILENVSGEGEYRNLEMTTAFQMLKDFTKHQDYTTWMSLKKTVIRILPYVDGTQLKSLFQTKILQPSLNKLYTLHVKDFVDMPETEEDKKFKKLLINLGTMLDVAPHHKLAMVVLEQWRQENFSNIFSNTLIHREIFEDVAGTVVGLMQDSAEIEVLAAKFHEHSKRTNDLTVLEPLKFIKVKIVEGSLFDLLDEMFKELKRKLRSETTKLSWIDETSNRISMLFTYLMSGSEYSYNFCMKFISTAIEIKMTNPDLFWKLIRTYITLARTGEEYDVIIEMLYDNGYSGAQMPLIEAIYPMVHTRDRLEWQFNRDVFVNALESIKDD